MMRRGWPQPSYPTCVYAPPGHCPDQHPVAFLCAFGESPTAVERGHIGYVFDVAGRRRADPHAFADADGQDNAPAGAYLARGK